MNWYLDVLKNKYATFSGRARRKEYWMFTLFSTIVSIILSVFDGMAGTITESGAGIISGIYALAVLIPTIALTVRRLHDTGRTGWWLLIGLVPLAGFLILLIFMLSDSRPGSNKYGANPKETVMV